MDGRLLEIYVSGFFFEKAMGVSGTGAVLLV
jgi:hypothetical protein